MAKEPKVQKVDTELDISVTDDEDFESEAQEAIGNLQDVMGSVDDKDYVKALEELDAFQETIDALHVYLTTKVDNG